MTTPSLLHIGTSTWSQDDWRGNFYPQDAKPADYLKAYSTRFSTVEIDSTFYAIPRPAVVSGWYAKTPAHFRFSVKLPQRITHDKQLLHPEEDLRRFLSIIEGLREKLAVILIQLPPYFQATLETVERMKTFLKLLPVSGFKFALEVRHSSWLRETFYDRLRSHGVVLCLTDQPAMSTADGPLWIETGPFLYLRWLGNRNAIHEPFTHVVLNKDDELKWWAKKVQQSSIKEGYGYFNNHFSGHSPSSANSFIRLL